MKSAFRFGKSVSKYGVFLGVGDLAAKSDQDIINPGGQIDEQDHRPKERKVKTLAIS